MKLKRKLIRNNRQRPSWYKRILRFDKIKTNGIRIVYDSARACPCINNVSAYKLSLNSQLFIRVRDATRLTLRTHFYGYEIENGNYSSIGYCICYVL